jgi:hypothetical protein
MVHEPQVLKMCYADMKERSILPGEIVLEFVVVPSFFLFYAT